MSITVCKGIVKVSSVKSGEIMKTSVKQPYNDGVSYQKVMYAVSHVFLPQVIVQMHPSSQNRPIGP